ncbi:response regulator [Plebeiibacterium sediminum]|uniref:Response regulator transcription factor n=1 Tax=Plebeiibacterium sediminum TaxID=2992112 RepID=A0AAE3M6M4_9BACT|nr:response regulator transcription factor [Plebeiobacterium sediminum]MCW3788189.1 response regulator transcription factor [Plebeiobacterium sediminum]
MKILIIEDEPKVVEFLKMGLEEQGYMTEIAYDGQLGERLAIRGGHDLILLDVILPLKNGFEVLRNIREHNNNVPILMLTALGTMDDKINGFDNGVDDYLVKPFEFKELLARIKSLTKRNKGLFQTSNTLKVADLILNLDKRIALRGDISIELTAKEFHLLEYMMKNKDKVLTRLDIAEKVWDINFDTGTNVVDVYINILRKKIDKSFEKKLIHTKIGMGYILSDH